MTAEQILPILFNNNEKTSLELLKSILRNLPEKSQLYLTYSMQEEDSPNGVIILFKRRRGTIHEVVHSTNTSSAGAISDICTSEYYRTCATCIKQFCWVCNNNVRCIRCNREMLGRCMSCGDVLNGESVIECFKCSVGF